MVTHGLREKIGLIDFHFIGLSIWSSLLIQTYRKIRLIDIFTISFVACDSPSGILIYIFLLIGLFFLYLSSIQSTLQCIPYFILKEADHPPLHLATTSEILISTVTESFVKSCDQLKPDTIF